MTGAELSGFAFEKNKKKYVVALLLNLSKFTIPKLQFADNIWVT